MLAFGKQVPFVMSNPDNDIDATDRAMLLYLYPGIALAGLPTTGAADNFFWRRRASE